MIFIKIYNATSCNCFENKYFLLLQKTLFVLNNDSVVVVNAAIVLGSWGRCYNLKIFSSEYIGDKIDLYH
jgi:hypothetical protein